MGTLKTDLHAVFDLDSGGIFYTERAKTQSVSFKILRRDQRDADHPVYSLYLHRCNRKREYDSRYPILFCRSCRRVSDQLHIDEKHEIQSLLNHLNKENYSVQEAECIKALYERGIIISDSENELLLVELKEDKKRNDEKNIQLKEKEERSI